MTEPKQDILTTTESYVTDFFRQHISEEYVFHDLQHTKNVVEAVKTLGTTLELTDRQIMLLQMAAWFHDMGYVKGPEGHEERGCRFARDFFSQQGVPEDDLQLITRCIMATRLPFQPQDQLEEIMCDADLSHLGKTIYWDRCGKLRQELLLTRKMIMSDQEWVQFELDFMNNHKYFTSAAMELYEEEKRKHIRQLDKQKIRLNPAMQQMNGLEEQEGGKEKKKKKKKKKKAGAGVSSKDINIREFDLGRGVETMYRTTYRTHINLSSIADNKANIMLSINAIVISIVLPQLLPMFADLPELRIPTFIMISVCVTAIVLATLSTRPKITEGKFSREDIESKRANLLFFGNFYEMPLKDYHWGMMEMIKDSEFLYSSMTKDLYYLGVVLAKKYRYLSYCYGVFMYGMIVSVLAFAIAFLL